ncbi:MAG: phage major capsid protein [Enterococcus faecalis]|nr:phage major capsid protein [Enterococcus faecalis]
MKKKQLMKMDIQMFAQTWNPDNATVLEKKDGTIPDKYNTLILKDVMENSKLMQLAKYEEMDGKEKKFEYFAEGPGAYWVGEGEKIKKSKPKWLNVTMTAKKIGVIIPVSREYLTYKMSDFFTQMQPKIAEAFYKKIDAATILDKENPFSQSIEKSVIAASNVIEGDLTYDNILALEDLLGEGEYDPNAFISNRKNRTVLREASKKIGDTTQFIYDRVSNTIDGLPVADLKSMDKGNLYTGDFDYLRYGIPFNINFKISEEAQLSTLTNEDGTPVNLYEQELVALRATMDIGFMVIKDEAFAKIQTKAAGE